MGLGGDLGSVLGPEGEKTKGPAGVTPSGGFDGKKKLGDRGRKGFGGGVVVRAHGGALPRDGS